MNTREVLGIALTESNDRGGNYFMSLYTGREIHGYLWKELIISDEVIDRVYELAQKEKRSCKLINRAPLFEWAPGIPIIDRPINEEQNEDDHKNTNNNEIEIILAKENEDNEINQELEEHEEQQNVDENMIVTDDKESLEERKSDDESTIHDKQMENEMNRIESDDETVSSENNYDNESANKDKVDNNSKDEHENIEYENGRPTRRNAGLG
eukprot:9828774-Ditylum_brightwellii.AAC.1